ncbi:MAG: hypothetical protein WCY11_10220 [Novosphingobium sp.]
MHPETRIHFAAVSDVLDELAQDIELLGEAMCADHAFVNRHMHELQTFDLIAQKQRSLANLLRSDCPVSALGQIGLDNLKSQLEAIVACAKADSAKAEGAKADRAG